MAFRILLIAAVACATSTSLVAQSFRGKYVVIAREIMLPPDSTGAERRLRYGDTVNVVARPTAVTYQIRVGEEQWIVQQDDLTRAVDFTSNSIDTLDASSGSSVMAVMPNTYPRQHTFRLSYGAGPNFPFEENIDVEVGLAWSLQAEILIDALNTHIGFGYQAFTMAYRNSFGEDGVADHRLLSMGVSFSFGSEPKRVTPYVSVLAAIDTEFENEFLFAPGFGLDWYVTPHAVIFGEIQPWVLASDFDLLWMPVKFGLRCAL